MAIRRLYFTLEHVSTEEFPNIEVPENCDRAEIVENIFKKYTEELKGVPQSTSQLTFYNREENTYSKDVGVRTIPT